MHRGCGHVVIDVMQSLCSTVLAVLFFYGGAALAQKKRVLPEGVTVKRDIAYVEGGHERQKLDIYSPKAKGEKPLPLVVWIHGGGWAKGSKDGIGNCAWVLEEGYALASVGYRLTDAAIFPAQVDDCKTGIQWLKDHAEDYGYDPDRIVVWGSSAGGHLVSMLGTTGDPDDASDDLQGIIDWFGPSELLTMQKERTLPTQLNADAPDSFESRLIGGTLQENPDKAREASPLTHVTVDDTPFLIMHGTRDALVPLVQSQRLQEALEEVGVSAQLEILEGAGHGGKEFQTDEARAVIRSFLKEQLAE